jgi:hypothetical protein
MDDKTHMLTKPSSKTLQVMWYAPTMKPVPNSLTNPKDASTLAACIVRHNPLPLALSVPIFM